MDQQQQQQPQQSIQEKDKLLELLKIRNPYQQAPPDNILIEQYGFSQSQIRRLYQNSYWRNMPYVSYIENGVELQQSNRSHRLGNIIALPLFKYASLECPQWIITPKDIVEIHKCLIEVYNLQLCEKKHNTGVYLEGQITLKDKIIERLQKRRNGTYSRRKRFRAQVVCKTILGKVRMEGQAQNQSACTLVRMKKRFKYTIPPTVFDKMIQLLQRLIENDEQWAVRT